MQTVARRLPKILFVAVAALVLGTAIARQASASRYAVAYGGFVVDCGTTPATNCPNE